MDAAPKGLRLGRRVDRPTYQPNIAADRKTGSSCCPFGVARKNQEQDAHDVGGGSDRSVSTNPPRLFCSARVRTWHFSDMPAAVTMSVAGRRSEVGGRFQSSAPVEWYLVGDSYIGLLARGRAHPGYRSHFYAHFLKIHSGV